METSGDQTEPSLMLGAGAVRATVPRTLSCGTTIPRLPENSELQTPAAQTTAEVRMRPCSVTTAETRPAAVSTPRTAQWVATETPWRAAARAMAGVARAGSARPSLAVKSAPAQRPSAPSSKVSSAAPVTTLVSS